MIDPLTLLIIGIFVIIISAIIFMPKKGLLSRLKIGKRNTNRILIEDALKHLYDYESRQLNPTLRSISGHLSISGDQATELVDRLEKMDLVSTSSDNINITATGRSYALRVIRIHRIWERYLADETGLEEIEWHKDAELKEHDISAEKAEEIAAKLGNPVYDPHGDPIPSPSGDLPEIKGFPLNSLRNGEFARIIHIEDEPQAIYSQLVALGLHPGMQVRMIDSRKEKIVFEANGEECVLAPLFAANVTVQPFPKDETIYDSFESLSSLKQGEEGIIAGISKACRGIQRRRLMDFGIVPGTKVMADMTGFGGDPVAYQIRGAKVALRKQQADLIFIKRN